MSIGNTSLLLIAGLLLALQAAGPSGAATTFTNRDLQKYEKAQGDPGERSGLADGPEALWPEIETWLDLGDIESQIERTKDDRDRLIDELVKQMEAERAECTGVVGAEYRFDGGVYGLLVDATAKKSCELAVERKYDDRIRDAVRAAEERLKFLSLRKEELEARQRGFR